MKKYDCRNIAILGPTGSGKTAVAHELAARMNAAIVSCDSMQVYRGLNIGSDKPAPADLQRFNYHLIDMLEMTESWNLDRFLRQARPLIKSLNHRGKSVLLVGGTGLYAKALIYHYQLPAADSAIYREIFARTTTAEGRAELHEEVLAGEGGNVPPDLLRNPRRLARAVEIVRLQGRLPENFVEIDAGRESTGFDRFSQFIIMPPDRELRQAIARRTRQMIERGWIEETRALLDGGLQQSPTARQVLGYSLVAAWLRGEVDSLEELARRIEQRTWQYARRQRTWFRRQHPGACLLTLRPGVGRNRVADAIASVVEGG